MSILINRDTRILCQGITGRLATFYCDQAIAYGSQIVAGVTPGRGGTRHLQVPVFDRVHDAIASTGANASIVFVPPAHAASAMIEAIDAQLELVVCVTEGVPVHDMLKVCQRLEHSSTRLIGPNSIGIITPGECKMGIMPGHIHQPGRIGVISRSSTLTYEIVTQLSAQRLGQSTVVSVGGDPVHPIGFTHCLDLMLNDADTQAIVLVGEIGGDQEQQAAAMLRVSTRHKPVFALVTGLSAPRGRRMGHAGAVIAAGASEASNKIEALERAGVTVVASPAGVGRAVKSAL